MYSLDCQSLWGELLLGRSNMNFLNTELKQEEIVLENVWSQAKVSWCHISTMEITL
jgi:hypothetical protein